MSRAEELANELFPEPKLENYDDILVYRADRDNAIMGRAMCYRVYEQAEKDLALTVEDIKTILDISFWNDDPETILEEYNRLCDTSKVTPR